jgi:hypothetical protein
LKNKLGRLVQLDALLLREDKMNCRVLSPVFQQRLRPRNINNGRQPTKLFQRQGATLDRIAANTIDYQSEDYVAVIKRETDGEGNSNKHLFLSRERLAPLCWA